MKSEFYKNKGYLEIESTKTELYDVKELASKNKSFLEILNNKVDYTETLMEELYNTWNSEIPRAFILGIRGYIGRLSGIFKTAIGMQIACSLDDNFSVSERIGFTPDELIGKVNKFGKRKQIFMLDEQVNDTKISSWLRLKNIMENCREQRLSFICAGIPQTSVTYMDYLLERIGESSDLSLPRKTVLYVVRKQFGWSSVYRGFFKWNVIPLSNRKWSEIWKEYSELKTKHQEKIKKSKVTGIDYEEKALKLVEEHKDDIIYLRKNAKLLIKKEFSDYTREDRDMIYMELINMISKYIKELKNKKDGDKDESVGIQS